MRLPRLLRRFMQLGFALTLPSVAALASATHTLDISGPVKPIQQGHLDLGGTGPGGSSVQVNSYYIEIDGKPVVPVVGEFHYSRYSADEWEAELRKIKAGGITTVASYVFWNLHERKQGQFDWSGNLDLRRFEQLVQHVGLNMVLRIGPFGHGEIRNGGIPDWAYGLPLEIRSNDAAYLDLADKLYAQIAVQVRGLLFKDGGPIIAIQLENEFQHSAAPWDIRYAGSPITRTVADRDVNVTHQGVSVSEVANSNATYGEEHMATLKRLAKKNGLDAPLYTATGWGNAAIVKRGSLPVTAAYPYPFWTETPTPSPFYLFTDLQKRPDYAPASFETTLYPSLPAELGAGMAATYARRAYVPEESVAPMIVRVLGSGSNGVGYYMYHGGATPTLDNVHFNEDASGLPKINYDYQAPLGQYGQSRSHYFELRPLHLFLQSFGAKLAPLPSVLPSGAEQRTPLDTNELRFAARAANGAGFIFLLNYQDHVPVQDLVDQNMRLEAGARSVSIPHRGSFTLKQNAYAILPVNLDLDGVLLRSATVQPLTVLSRPDAKHFVFFSLDGFAPELVFEGSEITALENCVASRQGGALIVTGPAGQCFSFSANGRRVLVVPPGWAPTASRIPGERLLFTRATSMVDGSNVTLLSAGEANVEVKIYPAIEKPEVTGGAVAVSAAPHANIAAFQIKFPVANYAVEWRQLTRGRFVARFNQGLGNLSNIYMKVPYVGDTGMAFIGGELVDDDFYFGRTWEIGLKQFLPRLQSGEMVFVFQPMMKNATYIRDIPPDRRPEFAETEMQYLKVEPPQFVPEYRAALKFN